MLRDSSQFLRYIRKNKKYFAKTFNTHLVLQMQKISIYCFPEQFWHGRGSMDITIIKALEKIS